MNKEMYKLLNDQWNAEVFSAYLYYEKAALVRELGMFNYYEFLKKSGDEELGHAQKIYDYMISIQLLPKVNEKMRSEVVSSIDFMDTTKILLNHEISVTACIHKIAKFALEVNDFGTFEFIQWFVKEQVEEEKKFYDLIKLAKLAQNNYDLDEKIGNSKLIS